MRKALIIGIDAYPKSPLTGSVTDANNLKTVIEVNGDGSPNFDVKLLTSNTAEVTRAKLRSSIRTLFDGDSDISLLYFSGHGMLNGSGGLIVAQDGENDDEGITMDEIGRLANASGARNKIIILDCCHSGSAGDAPGGEATLKDGLTILTASRNWESAIEVSGEGGVFTTLVVEALQGGAADVRGNITPGSLYAFVDEALGAWDQRPVFKSNVSSFAVIRMVQPRVPLEVLRRITDYFPTPSDRHNLNPTYEPERNGNEPAGTPSPDETNNIIFKELQKMVAASLVRPYGAPHMWHAAMESRSCELTALGRQYWRLSKEGMI